MKKIIIMIMSIITCMSILASPHWGRNYYHHHHGRDWVAPAAFVGGLILGSAFNSDRLEYNRNNVVYVTQPQVIYPQSTITTVPNQQVIVPTTPVIQIQQIWIEGKWVNTIQPDGRIVSVWIPGHYETRLVQVN